VDAVSPTTGQFVSLYWRDESEPSHYDEYSVFGDLTYNITERFNIQFGGRQSYIHSQLGVTTQTGPFVGNAPVLGPAVTTDESAFTYLATPQFRLGSDAMIYARFASGYRPGTPNLDTPGIPRSSDPDTTNNYEVGVKAGFFDHRLALDGSLYYINWTGIQIEETSPVSHVVYYTNGAAAKSEGIELSMTAKPARGLSVSSWFAYNDAALTQALPETTGLIGGPGSRLPFSTRFSGNLSLQQEFPVTHSIKGYVGAQGNYMGDQIGRFVAGPERQVYPHYGKLSLRGGLRYGSWTLNAYANNATDERAFVNGGIGYFYPVAKIYITPRTVGVNLVKTF
jgi:outer membrane receptor protein involved in Fe transport